MAAVLVVAIAVLVIGAAGYRLTGNAGLRELLVALAVLSGSLLYGVGRLVQNRVAGEPVRGTAG